MVTPLPSCLLDDSIHMRNSTIIDNPIRLKLASSRWLSFIHSSTKHRLDSAMQHQIMKLLQKKHGYEHLADFKKVWKAIDASKLWNTADPLTFGKLRQIDDHIRAKIIYHGPGIKAPPVAALPKSNPTVSMVIQALLHGGQFVGNALETEVAKAIFIAKDHNLLKTFRQELQCELDNLIAQPPQNKAEELVWRAFLGNVIALLPFTYPSEDEIFSIPILENGLCRRVDYKIHVMPLTVTNLSSPMIALGLTPQNDEKAPPYLTYIGTTYPAGDGYAGTLLADFAPAYSVGEAVYKRNHAQIDAWLQDKENVYAAGTSLGGAMVMHTLIHHSKKFKRIDLFVPPGLYKHCWKVTLDTQCDVNIFKQRHDFVSKMGMWPTAENVKLFNILTHQKGVKENAISSHARAFSGCDNITIIKLDPEVDNKSLTRRFLTTLHQAASWIIYVPIKCMLLFFRAMQCIKQSCGACISKLKAHTWTVHK